MEVWMSMPCRLRGGRLVSVVDELEVVDDVPNSSVAAG
jgi:hypothetical protein